MATEYRKAKLREYNRRYRVRHPERVKQQQNEYRARHRDRIVREQKEWTLNNPESDAASKAKWYQKNKDAVNDRAKQYWKDRPAQKAAHCANRRAQKKSATPPWANLKKIERIYMLAAWASKFTNERIEVDHIDPLTSDVICGLHCEDNLQLLPASQNYRKHNKFNVH